MGLRLAENCTLLDGADAGQELHLKEFNIAEGSMELHLRELEWAETG